MWGIACKVFLVRHCSIRGVGVGGVAGCLFPRSIPRPTDPDPCLPGTHHTMRLAVALTPAVAP